MKTKFDKPSKLTITAENDNERVLLTDFMNLQNSPVKQVLRVPRKSDKTLVLEKKQFINDKFIKKEGFFRIINYGYRTKLYVKYYNTSKYEILFGKGTYRYGVVNQNISNIFRNPVYCFLRKKFKPFRVIINDYHSNNEIMSFKLTDKKISTIEDYHNRNK